MDLSIFEGIIAFVTGLSAQYPILVGIFAILYSVGIAFKLLFTAFKEYVATSPSKSDDKLLSNIEGNKAFKSVVFVMDLLIRFKVK